MSHYYYYDKKTKSNEKEISSTVNNNKYLFITDNGVFSKNKIDFGTRLLLNEIDIDGPRKIVDYGCGYGVIGIVLKKKYPEAQLFFVDSNRRAVELTKKMS
jgi:16S rRNA (guanine1207-N2)-methyltransferase